MSQRVVIDETAALGETILRLAREFPGLPVAIVNDEQEGLRLGVMNLADVGDEDWFQQPVKLPQRLLEADSNQGLD